MSFLGCVRCGDWLDGRPALALALETVFVITIIVFAVLWNRNFIVVKFILGSHIVLSGSFSSKPGLAVQRVGPLILFLQSPSGYLLFKVCGAPYNWPLLLFFSFICLTTKIASVVVTVDIIFLILLSNACAVVFPYHFQQDMCHSTCSQSLHRMCGVAGTVCHHTWACSLSSCLWHFCLKVCWQWLIVTAYLHFKNILLS